MHNIHDAKTHLSKLVEQAMRGEEVVIGRAGKPVAKLIAYQAPSRGPRVGGQWKGLVRIADNFDKLPPELADAFGIRESENSP